MNNGEFIEPMNNSEFIEPMNNGEFIEPIFLRCFYVISVHLIDLPRTYA